MFVVLTSPSPVNSLLPAHCPVRVPSSILRLIPVMSVPWSDPVKANFLRENIPLYEAARENGSSDIWTSDFHNRYFHRFPPEPTKAQERDEVIAETKKVALSAIIDIRPALTVSLATHKVFQEPAWSSYCHVGDESVCSQANYSDLSRKVYQSQEEQASANKRLLHVERP